MGLTDMFKRKTPQEMIRENKRMIDRAIREMDRERVKMEQQEKKVIADTGLAHLVATSCQLVAIFWRGAPKKRF